jgi:hypothetical protein
MIPSGQGCTAMAQDGKCAPVVWFGAYPKDGENVYTESEIKAWLMEEPSAEVIHRAVESYDSNDGSMVEYCRGLFAAKLEELK